MRGFKVKGNTAEQKLSHMETIVTRLARRTHKAVGVVIPPIPISIYIADAGSILNIGGGNRSYLFPIEGKIEKIFAKVLWDSFLSGSLHAKIDSKEGTPGNLFSLSKISDSFDTSISVKAGSYSSVCYDC
jgi:hypothetical protein